MNFLSRLIYELGTHLFEGFVLKTVWGWFLVPLGVIVLPYWTAVVIVLLIGWLVFQIPFTGLGESFVDEYNKTASTRITMFLLMAVQMLVFAWVIHLIAR